MNVVESTLIVVACSETINTVTQSAPTAVIQSVPAVVTQSAPHRLSDNQRSYVTSSNQAPYILGMISPNLRLQPSSLAESLHLHTILYYTYCTCTTPTTIYYPTIYTYCTCTTPTTIYYPTIYTILTAPVLYLLQSTILLYTLTAPVLHLLHLLHLYYTSLIPSSSPSRAWERG